MAWWHERTYVSADQRSRRDARHAAKLTRQGRTLAPIKVAGRRRQIAETFWGRAWCENLEHYSDYESRMPRGRTYVRSGAVIDLQIGAGTVTALVSGTEIYEVKVTIRPLAAPRWQALVQACAGQIGSLVELLQGKLSDAVMEKLVHPRTGMFPAPAEIALSCSCPDWANMCKHVAAVLYGVGVRLDLEPAIFFTLRQVDQLELVAAAGAGGLVRKPGASGKKVIAKERLSALFGIELDEEAAPPPPPPPRAPARKPSRAGGRKRAP